MNVFAAGAGERNDAPEEAAGGARGHEASLPSNGAEGGGPAGQTGTGRHQERTQQVMMMMMSDKHGSIILFLNLLQTIKKNRYIDFLMSFMLM